MLRLRYSAASKEDLKKIAGFIAKDNPVAARQWVERIREKNGLRRHEASLIAVCPLLAVRSNQSPLLWLLQVVIELKRQL